MDEKRVHDEKVNMNSLHLVCFSNVVMTVSFEMVLSGPHSLQKSLTAQSLVVQISGNSQPVPKSLRSLHKANASPCS